MNNLNQKKQNKGGAQVSRAPSHNRRSIYYPRGETHNIYKQDGILVPNISID
jgi:hypothetical protein